MAENITRIGENIGRGFSIGISDEGSAEVGGRGLVYTMAEGTGHRGLTYSFEGSSGRISDESEGRIHKMSEESTGT